MNASKVKAMRYFLLESQVEFGKRVGVAASTICAIENKHRDISDYIRARLVKIEASLPQEEFNIFYDSFKKSA
ncbi:MAG: hypothetical protein AB2401_10340 [Bacillus sp. (in: firmicutes)]